MRRVIIRRLGVSSVARFMGVAQAIIGFAVGFVALFGGISAVLVQSKWGIPEKMISSVGAVLFCLIILPLISFLLGWLYGALLSLIANLFLHTSSGIELDIENIKDEV